jgi:protein Mpv17
VSSKFHNSFPVRLADGNLVRFLFLGNHFNYASPLLSLATKVVVNQLVFTPIFNSYFFGMQSLLSNLPNFSLQNTWEHIQRTVPVSFVNSCKLWPAVTAFSFTFISAQYRSIFAGFIAIGWQTYLSYLNRLAENMESIEHKAKEIEEHLEANSKRVQQNSQEQEVKNSVEA